MNHNGLPLDQQQVDLSDSKWRDDNIDTLGEWHPSFYSIQPQLEELIKQFGVIKNAYYQQLLAESDDSPSELKNHIQDEVLEWFFNRLEDA